MMAAVMTSLQYPGLSKRAERDLEIVTAFFMIPLLMSCCFLLDAFRRFRNTQKPQ